MANLATYEAALEEAVKAGWQHKTTACCSEA
jgi:hypothetical protein